MRRVKMLEAFSSLFDICLVRWFILKHFNDYYHHFNLFVSFYHLTWSHIETQTWPLCCAIKQQIQVKLVVFVCRPLLFLRFQFFSSLPYNFVELIVVDDLACEFLLFYDFWLFPCFAFRLRVEFIELHCGWSMNWKRKRRENCFIEFRILMRMLLVKVLCFIAFLFFPQHLTSNIKHSVCIQTISTFPQQNHQFSK